MANHFPSLITVAALLATIFAAAPVHADQARTFVSGLGNDQGGANADCLRATPCRTFMRTTWPVATVRTREASSPTLWN